ncbi:anoctamin-1 [Polymixia lowei]
MTVTTAMSESSSIHSEKLFSLARSLSGLGLDAANGGLVNAPDDDLPPPPESGIELGPGLYFADGRRKVDYVLCYKYKKGQGSKPRLSIGSNGSIPMPLSARWDMEAELGEAGQGSADGEESRMTDEEKAMTREEFEAGLLEAGLLIERDKERSHGIGFIRLHIPWSILSREAELQKIKVAVKKKCELRKPAGIAGVWDSLMTKVAQPFQPDVPDLETSRDSQTRVHFKTLKHPFIREKLHLYDIKSTETLFDNATRSRIVAEIISRTTCTQTCQTTGITSLLARGVYDSAFPLHDGSFTRRGRKDQRNDRQLLHEEWANYGVMHKYQPVDLIRKYFGEQIGLYFSWLGVYTQFLIPPSLLGIIVFVYGILTVDANVPSQETCNDNLNITMCPLCDGVCDYWRLSTVCSLARASYLFDNGATVLFAIFMSLWAACFLEHWKRRQMCLKHSWDLTSLEDEEEELRPEYEAALQEKKKKMKENNRRKSDPTGHSADGETDQMLASQREPESLDIEDHLSGYLINVSTLLFLIGITFSAVFGVAMYRICMLTVWSMNPDPEAKASVRMTVTTTGIILNMLVVLVLEEVYGAIAFWLTELELPKTEAEFGERLIFKSFFLKSMNAFAPIFYVAFFKGRFSGRPGDYVYIFGDYRMEECAPPGCLIELCIQLSLIMLGKQLIQNNVFEIVIPKLKKMYRTMQEEKGKKQAANDEEDEMESRPKQQFDKDFALEPFEGVSPEYMEMIIQYGFVSLFVASFPLAPAFALLNNVIEIRLDAAKFVSEIRRPDAVRCKDIGIWYNILCGISKFSVITNAFVISFTSEFIPRMVYQYMYSVNGTMDGYTEHSLAYFNVSNFPPGTAPTSTLVTGVSMCRYKDYRDPPWEPDAYTFSKPYWSVLAARLAFVIFFQNLAMFLSMLVAWMIPDVPRSLREQLKRENMLLMEFLLSGEQAGRPKRRYSQRPSLCVPANIDIVVEAPVEEEEEENKTTDVELPKSGSRQAFHEEQELPTWRDPPSKRGSSQSLVASAASVRGSDPRLFSLIGPPPREPGPKAKARCSTLPSCHRGSEANYSLPRPSHSTSLTRFQQMATHAPLVPLRSPAAVSSGPFSPPRTPTSPTSTRPHSPDPEHLQPKAPSPSELFMLKGPPLQELRSRAKGRSSTLPARQRGPGPEKSSTKPSHSTSFTRLGERVPPSPSELKRDTQV